MATRLMVTRRDLLSASAASVAISAANLVHPAIAQPLAKTAHILTGFTPGLQDALARLIADRMKDYAEAIVVETRPGAAGRVAVEAVKTADPDGSVMLPTAYPVRLAPRCSMCLASGLVSPPPPWPAWSICASPPRPSAPT